MIELKIEKNPSFPVRSPYAALLHKGYYNLVAPPGRKKGEGKNPTTINPV